MLKARDTQTQVKHLILEHYLSTWTGIIYQGLKGKAKLAQSQKRAFKIRFVYVDGFGYCGRYSGDKIHLIRNDSDSANSVVYGSPIIGVRALDKIKEVAREDGIDLQVQVNAIIVEEDKSNFTELLTSFQIAGIQNRLKEVEGFETLNDGEIAVLNCDFHKIVDKILQYTQDPVFAFYLLDPYGPTGIPLEIVRPIVTQQKNDTMINFPYLDLVKKTGVVKNQALVDNWTKVFEDKGLWRQKYEHNSEDNFQNNSAQQRAEEVIVKYYYDCLCGLDKHLAVKYAGLQFPDRERSIFYLFLTTHDPTGALALNKVIYEHQLEEKKLRWQYRQASKIASREQKTQQMELGFLGIGPPPHIVPTDREDIEEVANELFKIFKNQKRTYRDVLKELVNTHYFPDEIKKALTKLKQSNHAKYKDLRYNDLIEFA